MKDKSRKGRENSELENGREVTNRKEITKKLCHSKKKWQAMSGEKVHFKTYLVVEGSTWEKA